MSNFSTYRIGRGSDVDIRIDDRTVSRVHAELVVTAKGAYYLTDCDSSGGSYVARNGEWEAITQDFISPMDAILLGRYQTTAQQLMTMVNQGGRDIVRRKDDLPEGPVRRNVDTGEIIGDKD